MQPKAVASDTAMMGFEIQALGNGSAGTSKNSNAQNNIADKKSTDNGSSKKTAAGGSTRYGNDRKYGKGKFTKSKIPFVSMAEIVTEKSQRLLTFRMRLVKL